MAYFAMKFETNPVMGGIIPVKRPPRKPLFCNVRFFCHRLTDLRTNVLNPVLCRLIFRNWVWVSLKFPARKFFAHSHKTLIVSQSLSVTNSRPTMREIMKWTSVLLHPLWDHSDFDNRMSLLSDDGVVNEASWWSIRSLYPFGR